MLGFLTLVDSGTGDPYDLIVSRPFTTELQTGQRVIIDLQPIPEVDGEVQLVIPSEALVDDFLNSPADSFEITFAWPATNAVVADSTAPRVEAVVTRSGRIEIELSEEPDPAAVPGVIDVPGESLTWSLDDSRYLLISDQTLSIGDYQLTIGTEPLDLAGLGLGDPLLLPIEIGSEDAVAYETPDPREVGSSTVENDIGFHGRPVDPATGLVYFRNRWLDPDLGRFVSADPFLYADGPNPGQFALHSPLQLSDPFGTRVHGYSSARGKTLDGRRAGQAGYAEFDETAPGAVSLTPTLLGYQNKNGNWIQGLADTSKRMVLFIHGYAVGESQFTGALRDFDQGFSHVGAEQDVYGFTWRGDPFLNDGWARPFFGFSEQNADMSAVALAKLVRGIRGHVGYGGFDLFGVSHSLGARVVLRGLQTLSAWNRGINGGAVYQNELDGAFMFNGAVTRRSLSEGGYLEEAFYSAGRIANYFSKEDPALKAFKWRKWGKALGSGEIGGRVSDRARPGQYREFNLMLPEISGNAACTHGKHLSVKPYEILGGKPKECLGSQLEHSGLFRQLAGELNSASSSSFVPVPPQ